MSDPSAVDSAFIEPSGAHDCGVVLREGLGRLSLSWTISLVWIVFSHCARFAATAFFVADGQQGREFTNVLRVFGQVLSLAGLAVGVLTCAIAVTGLRRIASAVDHRDVRNANDAPIAAWSTWASVGFIVSVAIWALLALGDQLAGPLRFDVGTLQQWGGVAGVIADSAAFAFVLSICVALARPTGIAISAGARGGLLLALIYQVGIALYEALASGGLDLGMTGWLVAGIAEAAALYGCATYVARQSSRAIETSGAWGIGGASAGVGARDGAGDSGTNDVLVGGIMLVGGLFVTIASYSAASSGTGGGRYVVTTGAILFGAIRLVRGLSRGNRA